MIIVTGSTRCKKRDVSSKFGRYVHAVLCKVPIDNDFFGCCKYSNEAEDGSKNMIELPEKQTVKLCILVETPIQRPYVYSGNDCVTYARS